MGYLLKFILPDITATGEAVIKKREMNRELKLSTMS